MPKPEDMLKLEDLIEKADAGKLHEAVKTHAGWKKAMERSWLAIGKGSGKETEAVNAAYLKFQDTSVAKLVAVGDSNTLLKLDKLVVDWLVKKKNETTLDKLKTHKRFHAMLALSDHIDDLVNEMNMLNKDKLGKVNNMADTITAIKAIQVSFGQTESAMTGKPAVISSFQAMHHLFAPPGFQSEPVSEKDKPVSSAKPSEEDPVLGEQSSPKNKN
jgi:DNA polymerase III alpha subunit